MLPEGALQLVSARAATCSSTSARRTCSRSRARAAPATLLRGLRSVVGQSVRVNVEADSLNAAVLGDDVEPGSDTYTMFVRDVAREMTQKTGQKCTATRRVFVPRAVIDRVARGSRRAHRGS